MSRHKMLAIALVLSLGAVLIAPSAYANVGHFGVSFGWGAPYYPYGWYGNYYYPYGYWYPGPVWHHHWYRDWDDWGHFRGHHHWRHWRR